MARQRVVTLLTDFGTGGSYVAQMKGVLLALAPGATIVDITHDIPPGDVLAGAFVLGQALRYFPPGTVHCVVVDPTVGTERRVLAGRYAGRTVVFPDNGVITFVNRDQPLEAIAAVRDERYFLSPGVSTTFHGRDIIAPVAAHLVNGLSIGRLGPQPAEFKLLDLPEPRTEADGSVVGQVIYVDGFGSLVSNISLDVVREGFGSAEGIEVLCGGRSVGPIRRAYAEVERGQPLALFNSMSLTEIAVNAGRACDVLDAAVGTEVRIKRAG